MRCYINRTRLCVLYRVDHNYRYLELCFVLSSSTCVQVRSCSLLGRSRSYLVSQSRKFCFKCTARRVMSHLNYCVIRYAEWRLLYRYWLFTQTEIYSCIFSSQILSTQILLKNILQDSRLVMPQCVFQLTLICSPRVVYFLPIFVLDALHEKFPLKTFSAFLNEEKYLLIIKIFSKYLVFDGASK